MALLGLEGALKHYYYYYYVHVLPAKAWHVTNATPRTG
jgi:hypothetical protein